MTFRREKDVNRAVSLLDYSSPTRKSAKTCMVFEATFEIHTCTKQTDKEKKRHKYTTGKLSDWSVKSLNSCRREKKPRNIEEAMESGAEQQPLYTVLPEKLIQPPTISSKEDSFRSVTYSKNDNAFYPSSGSVLSVRRLPPAKKRKKT